MNYDITASVLHLLHRASQRADELFMAGQPTEPRLTPRQFAVLATISKNEGLNQTEIVNLTGVDRSTVADITRRLVKSGLLSRRRTRADARAYSVSLTATGRERLIASEDLARQVDQTLLQNLPADARERLSESIQLLTQAETPLRPATGV